MTKVHQLVILNIFFKLYAHKPTLARGRRAHLIIGKVRKGEEKMVKVG